jgi:hypothetical protein
MGPVHIQRRFRRARPLAQQCGVAALMLLAGPVFCAEDFPPPIGAQPDRVSPADARAGATPDAASQPQGGTADDAPAPQSAPPKADKDVRIEQKHVGRRVSEVIVTPAGFTYHYTMTHLDDQDPGRTLLQPHPELSVPRFFRIDF